MDTQKQAAEIERKTRCQSNHLHGVKSGTSQKHLLSLVESANFMQVLRSSSFLFLGID